MKLKLVTVEGKTYAEVQDGKPVFTADDGREIAFDAAGTIATISRLNGEAKGHREAKEAAEAKLKAFDGITDPSAAKDALDKIRNIDAKKLIDAGEVEKVKAEAIKAVEEKYSRIAQERDALRSDLYKERVGGQFARSKFINEKAAVPADIMQARFGSHFKDEDGKAVAYDASGNKIYSRAKPGEPADFDEALEILVDQYPYKDMLLKGTGGGSGARPGNGGGAGGKSISRSEFDKLPPADQMTKIKEGVSVLDA
jgi:hypothetical protein